MKNRKPTEIDVANTTLKGNALATVSKYVKKGRIKANSKKETKLVKRMCVHNFINQKGKVKQAIENPGNGYVTCTLCGKSFPTSLFGDSELDKRTDAVDEFLDQGKYMSVQADLGKAVTNQLVQTTLALHESKRNYKKIRKIVEKNQEMKKKKGKNGKKNKKDIGSSAYGGWA